MSAGATVPLDMWAEGYYWARHQVEKTLFIVLHDDGAWYCCGLGHPIDFDPRSIICPVTRPLN